LEEEAAGLPKAEESTKIWSRLSSWILFVLVLLLPLVVNPLGTDHFVLPKLVFLRLATLALVVLWVLDAVFKQELALRKTFLDKPVLAVILAVLVSAFFSIHLQTGLYGEYRGFSYEGLLTILNYFLLFFLVVHIVDSREKALLIVTGLLAGLFVVSSYGILQHISLTLGFPFPTTGPTAISVTFGNTSLLGGYIALLVPLAFSLLLSSDFRKLNFRLLTLVVLTSLVCLFFTRVGSAFLGVGLAMVFVVVFDFGAIKKNWPNKIPILLFVALFWLVIFFQGSISKDKLTSFTQISAINSRASKALMWQPAFDMIREYPLLGVGPDCYGLAYPKYRPANWLKLGSARVYVSKPRNEILYTASTLGLLGLAVAAWLFITFFRKGLSLLRSLGSGQGEESTPGSRALLIGLLAGAFSYLVYLQFSFREPSTTPFLWILIGLVVAGFNLVNDQKNDIKISLRFFQGEKSGLVIRQLIAVVAGLLFVLASSRVVYPLRANIHLQNALDYEKRDDLKSAFGEYDKALTYIQDEDYYVHFGQAYLKLAQDMRRPVDIDQAIRQLEKAVEANPVSSDTHYELGRAYLIAGRIENRQDYVKHSAVTLGRAWELDPYSPSTLVELGKSFFFQGKVKEAIKWWEDAVQVDSSNTEAYLYLGWAYRQQGMKPKAIETYKKVLKLEPGNSVAEKALEKLLRKIY